MIEELKALLTMVQNVPETILQVAAGFAIYKIIVFLGTTAGIYGTLRLAINKYHDIKITTLNKKPDPVVYDLKSGHFIEERDMHELLSMLREIKDTVNSPARYSGHNYIHSSDMSWLRLAVKDKKAKDAAEVAARKTL